MAVFIFTTAPGPSSMTQLVPRDVIIRNETSSIPEDSNMTSSAAAVPDGCVVFPLSSYSPWNNPEDLVPSQVSRGFLKVLNVYLLTLFFLLSTPLNTVNMVVFWKHGIKERINLCLFCLALADFIVVAGHFGWQFDDLYAALTNTPKTRAVAKVTINNMVHSLAGFIYISGFMTTLIAFERCLCVASPLKAQSIIPLKTTAVVITVGHVVIFACHYVIATRWGVICLFDPFIGQSIDGIYPSQFYFDHKAVIDVLDGIVFGIFLPGFYVLGVSMSTVIIILKLRQMKSWRDQFSSGEATMGSASKDITLTRMLIATNVLFVVCTTPPLIFHALTPFFPDLRPGGKYNNMFSMLVGMQQLFTFCNSSANFFFYYFFGTKFRQTVQQMFCTWRGKKILRGLKGYGKNREQK